MPRRIPAFLLLWVMGLFPFAVWSACPLPAQSEPARVTQVIDGDTLELKDKTRVRLIGINTPEIGRDGKPDDPGARQASAALRDLLAGSGWRVRLVADGEGRDRYGRRLAHLFDDQRRNLSEQLIERGLAYQSPFPANPKFLDCYKRAEDEARGAKRGLWGRPPLDAARIKASATGFERIAGRVKSVGSYRDGMRIKLEGGLDLYIQSEDLRHFDVARLRKLTDQRLEVHGWIYRQQGQPRMRLRHPAAIISPTL
ncbi:MAG: thermonuclease family protein [Chromatiaceae bacterium]|nr:thermonuclease family protein [Chromatiaceae bacterium]MBP9604335.1 thermonuclease family protein [Chromatiaceae bacterium]